MNSAWRYAAAAFAIAALSLSLVAGEPSDAPSVTLTPAVLQLNGIPGAGTTQTLTITNNSDAALTFDLSVVDVVTRDGKRVFLPPGELTGSIAATAVVRPRRVTAQPHSSASAELTLTLPMKTSIRAIVARFQGQPKSVGQGPAISMGVGSLVTFNLSDEANATASALTVRPQSATRNLAFSDEVENQGQEPFITSGVVAILDSAQRLVTKLPVPATRFLPGERLLLRAEAPGVLPPGRYRAVMTLSYSGHVLSQTADFQTR
jgi:hypothetical protein